MTIGFTILSTTMRVSLIALLSVYNTNTIVRSKMKNDCMTENTHISCKSNKKLSYRIYSARCGCRSPQPSL